MSRERSEVERGNGRKRKGGRGRAVRREKRDREVEGDLN